MRHEIAGWISGNEAAASAQFHVAEMILAQMDVRRRVMVIKHFVAVADVSINKFLPSDVYLLLTNAKRNAVG